MLTKKVYILFLLILFKTQFCYSQNTVVVPDANFRSFLINNYPGVMAGSLLDTIQASNITGTLNCRAKSIANISGIQYFKKIQILNLNSNQISSIPPLRNFTNLERLSCDSNLLNNLPELKSIPTLLGI